MFKKTYLLVAAICLLSLFSNLFWDQRSPPCFDADEAAFGYNAYSLLKTARDEYGKLFPLRLKSFGDYKMPLYSYASVPFIATLGLNETGTRAINDLVALLFPLVIFLLTKELFNSRVGIIAAFLTAVSLGLHIVGRQAHEAYLAAFMLSTTLFFFIKICKRFRPLDFGFFLLFLLFSLFSYHSNRIFIAFFVIAGFVYLFRSFPKKSILAGLFFAVLGLFLITDIIYKPVRVQNLLLFANRGFSIKIDELKTEGGIKPLYNSFLQGIKDATFSHLSYFSPQFLVLKGDDNTRFGFNGMSLMTPIEYIFIFIGFYFLYKNKERWRYLLTGLFVLSPLSASLSWADMSLTRSLFFIVPSLIIAAYGMSSFIQSVRPTFRTGTIAVIALLFLFFAIYSWDFYLFHYPKRAIVVRSWQCGYQQLAQYVQDNYSRFDKFYITKKHGEPYIFLLFYLKYPPSAYQTQATLSPADQYGFGQVDAFDKFNFNFKPPELMGTKTVSIGYPDDFDNIAVDMRKIKKITYRTEDIFWIYEK